jgi:hypothetical protein
LNELFVFEDKLTTAQMDQVETYLAIKYGTTYSAGTRDYKSASGTTVWNVTTNAGLNNNIAGIGRDQALNQKQSWSTNTGNQVLIGLGTLANTNAANGTSLTAGQYLIWGDNGLAKTPSVVIAGITGISHRFAAIWKVQNTNAVGTVRVAWPKGFTNLRLIQSADNIFNASDVVTDMSANEVTINGELYNYADVTLTDGQYFTFGAKVSAPGGVTNDLRVWLRSDAGFAPAQWQDFSGNTNHYTQTNVSRQPFIATQSFNFNPIVDFGTTGSDGRFLVVPSGKPYAANGTNSTLFTAQLSKNVSGYADIIGFGATTTTASLINANVPVYTRLGDKVVIYPYTSSATLPAVVANKLYLNDVSFTVASSGIKYGQNGQTVTIASTVTAGNVQHASGSILGSQPETRNGFIGEVIAYERDLSEAEKQRVRSYVAIKYGITLPHNYIASNGTTEFWNIATNTGYNNNIAGIARDDDGSLYQKQSKSIENVNNVLVGLGPLANSNTANAATLSNGQSVLWGDNGLAKSLSIPFTGVPAQNLRFAAIWKVQNTGTVGTVRVAWPSGIPALALVQSTDAVFDATDTRTDMTVNTQVVNGIAYNYADVTLSDGQYFTFAGYIAGPGGVGTDLSLWYKADNGVTTNGSSLVTEWATTTTNAVNLTPSGSAILPYNDQTTYTSTWNFNPTVTFNGSNNYLRNNTTAYLNAAGSVHYITVARNPKRDANARALFAISGNDDGFFYSGGTGNTALPTIGNNYGTTGSAIATPYNYGIYSAIMPKTGSPANQRGFYNGLMKIYTSPYPITAGYTLPTIGAYMGADGTTGDNFNGDIAEVVLYHNTTGGDMLNADLARIHSYLAIKYGITLDQTTAQNYVNSSGSVVWDAVTTNTGYNNHIAGIGRDDVGSLSQKQSRSVNAGTQVLISTTGLDNTNATNTGILTNGQFLIWGDNGLAKNPAVAISGIAGVNYHFAAIWKAQNTNGIGTVRVAWPAGYANLKLIQSTDATFDASDVVSDMTNEQLVNGVRYAYTDVTINDGQYFTFAAFIQAPGGVTNNLSYWYRADKLVDATGVGADVTAWTDFTSGVTSAQLGDNTDLPVLAQGSSTYFNYNPGINFTATSQGLGNINVQTVTSLNYDIFTLTKEGLAPGGNGRVFSSLVNNTNLSGSINYWDGIGIMADQRIERVNNAFGSRYLANPGNVVFSTNSPSIMYNTFTDLSVSKGVNGAINGSPGSNTTRGQFNGGHAFGSTQFSGNGSDNAGFTGNLGEVVIYGNGNITAPERNKVESYLAIKYGITLNSSNNYTTSQDVVVWDATNSAYYNNVAGIGNDYISALHQKQSRSQHTNSNGQVIIALGDIAETNVGNTNLLNDGQFLIWGDNGNTQAMTNSSTTYTALTYAGTSVNRRMNRVWKVQNTNNVSGEVKIRFPQASVGTTALTANDACAGYVIIYADDTAFTSNVVVVPVTVNGTDYEAMHRFRNGSSYFTFGKATPISTGVVYLPEVIETTTQTSNNCGISTGWTYFRNSDDASLKLLATSGVVTTPLTVNITPEGVAYDDGTRLSKLMPRIATVTDATAGTYSGVKVRVYYSQDELDATTVNGAMTNGWFKYSGDQDAVLADIYNDGVFTSSMATALTPNASGVEDGVKYVEFNDITSLGSFVYLSTTEPLSIALPVNLLSFTAKVQQQSVLLDWATASEKDNDRFEIERSSDAQNWSFIGAVKSKSGDAGTVLNYTFKDASPVNGINYYRLRQIDQGGQFTYSQVQQAVISKFAGTITIAPNPVRQELKISGLDGNSDITVSDAFGRTVLKTRLQSAPDHIIDMSRYITGVYFIRIELENGRVTNHKIVKE